MQLSGNPCAICKKNIVFDLDASWCAGCSAIFHLQCIENSAEKCPTCQQRYERPETKFVFSQQCPECFQLNEPTHSRCVQCGAGTQWDTRLAYEDFLAQMKDTSRICLFRGIAELIGAVLCLLALFTELSISGRPVLFALSLLVLGFMTLTTDGLLSLMRSKRIANFR